VKRIVICLLMIMVFCSCSDKKDFETYIGNLGIAFAEPYKIDSIKQYGFADWTLEAAVEVHEKDKDKILDKIKRLGRVKKVNSRDFYFDSTHVRKDSTYRFIIGSKYYYGLYKTRYGDNDSNAGYETYELNLDTLNNKVFFTYGYE
jgi:hypothetical protein